MNWTPLVKNYLLLKNATSVIIRCIIIITIPMVVQIPSCWWKISQLCLIFWNIIPLHLITWCIKLLHCVTAPSKDAKESTMIYYQGVSSAEALVWSKRVRLKEKHIKFKLIFGTHGFVKGFGGGGRVALYANIMSFIRSNTHGCHRHHFLKFPDYSLTFPW